MLLSLRAGMGQWLAAPRQKFAAPAACLPEIAANPRVADCARAAERHLARLLRNILRASRLDAIKAEERRRLARI